MASPPDWAAQLAALETSLGFAPSDTGHVAIDGHEHEYPGPHRLTLAAGLALAAAGSAIERLGVARGLAPQHLSLGLAAAGRFLFPELNFGLRLAGKPLALGNRQDAPLLQAVLATKDQRFFVPSALSPALCLRWARALGCEPTSPALTEAALAHDAAALEQCALTHSLPGALCRTPSQWLAHPQGALLAAEPLLVDTPRAHRAPRALVELPRQGAQPLSGVRVVCLGRVFAGPIAARLLAEHGAEVLFVGLPGAHETRAVWLEGHAGGRATAIDWRTDGGREKLAGLLQGSDVVIDNLRPGALESAGIWPPQNGASPVRVSIRPFGADGPWALLPGYDMTTQAATGVMATEGGSGRPRLVPTVLAADFLAGALAAAAAAQALSRGASSPAERKVSLARVWMWVQSLGIRPAYSPAWCAVPPRIRVRTPWGSLRRGQPVVAFSGTPARIPALGVPAPDSAAPHWCP